MDSPMERLEALEREMSELKAEKRAADQRVRWWRGAACALTAVALIVVPMQTGQAAGSGASPSLVRRVRTLEAEVIGLSAALNAEIGNRADGDTAEALARAAADSAETMARLLSDSNLFAGIDAEISARSTADSALKTQTDKLVDHVSVQTIDGFRSLVIDGANLHIRSGANATNAPVNGVGNVIIGYSEAGRPEGRLGSHNLVIGPGHAYTSYGGLIAGAANLLTAPYASVTGGYLNSAVASHTTIAGGFSNTTHGVYSSIGGGAGNSTGLSNTDGNPTTAGAFAHVCGGENNAAQAEKSSILGGFGRQINVVQGTLFRGAPGGD